MYRYRPASASLRQRSYHRVATSVVVLLTLQATASPLARLLLQTSSRLPKLSCNRELVSQSSSSLNHLASSFTTSRLYVLLAARPPLKRAKYRPRGWSTPKSLVLSLPTFPQPRSNSCFLYLLILNTIESSYSLLVANNILLVNNSLIFPI